MTMPADPVTEQFASPAHSVTGSQPYVSDTDDSVDLLNLAILLANRKRFILFFAFTLALLTAIVSLVLPPTFTAIATMLPPQKESSASALLGQLGGLASLAGGGAGASMLGLKNPADLYIGLLQSETIENALVHKFHLKGVYHQKTLTNARNSLKLHTTILAEKSSLISIAVKDHDPQLAAAIANAYIEELHDLMSHLAVTEASQRRMFFEQQLETEKNKLADAEVAMEATQQKTGIIQPQGQAQAVIATVMQLQAQISAREVELGALRTSATDQNPKVVTLQSQISGLRSQLADFEKGHPESASITGDILTPTSRVPAASLEYIRGMRDVKYHETLFELMARQYEMAKVDEAKQGQTLQVVDPASAPETRSWPPRTLLTFVAFVLGLMLSCLWVILEDYHQRILQDPEKSPKLRRLTQTLRN